MDASGEVVDVSGEVVDVSGQVVDVSGEVVEVPIVPPPPAPVTIEDILNSARVLAQKEALDKAQLDAIGMISVGTLRTTLIQWGVLGFPNAYLVQEVSLDPPSVCSDGVVRTLEDYIQFCSGKTNGEHIASLQEKVSSAIQVGFTNLGGSIGIVVTRV
jgi:hypothetical protein